MRLWLGLVLLGLSTLAQANPDAFGITINQTTLAELREHHQVTPITSRDKAHNPAPLCLTYDNDCRRTTPIEGLHAYTLDIKESGAQYFEVRTDDSGVVKFMLIKLASPDEGENSRSIRLARHFAAKYFQDFDHGLWQWGYVRTLYQAENAWVMRFLGQQNDFCFVILSDKEYLKNTRYDVRPFYHKEKTVTSQF
ncbi:hypothetical protein ACWX0P_30790 [Vibrio mediterranei]